MDGRYEECAEHSWLMTYLPGIYHDDPFLGGFLRIFESIWEPLLRQMDQFHAYFDPSLTPSDFLPWLGVWFALVLDENWPEDRRRILIRRAADLYERRGTLRGLQDYLEIYMSVAPEITESQDDARPFHFTVRFRLEQPARANQDRIRRIIEEEKPAHTTYTLVVEQR